MSLLSWFLLLSISFFFIPPLISLFLHSLHLLFLSFLFLKYIFYSTFLILISLVFTDLFTLSLSLSTLFVCLSLQSYILSPPSVTLYHSVTHTFFSLFIFLSILFSLTMYFTICPSCAFTSLFIYRTYRSCPCTKLKRSIKGKRVSERSDPNFRLPINLWSKSHFLGSFSLSCFNPKTTYFFGPPVLLIVFAFSFTFAFRSEIFHLIGW